jgi:hypothetical protein
MRAKFRGIKKETKEKVAFMADISVTQTKKD